uniref:Uncharacterized protein n=1 Tax=Sciurus vulgaris TaxID=55149 RepID=A0A8D2D9X0_SCIVU
MGIILQKMEMSKQTRHRKLKVLEMPSEVCAFLITVLLVTVQFEKLFFMKFYKNVEFCFTFFLFSFLFFFFLSYVVSTQNTSLLFSGEGAYVTSRMSPKLDCCGGKTFSPASFERLPLVSQEEGFPDVGTLSHLGTNTLWYEKTQIHLMSSSSSLPSA